MHQNYGFDKYINRQDLRHTIRYVVKQGDSLYKIAEAYNTTVAAIVTLNNLTSTTIYPNQVLFIPSNNSDMKITLKEFLLSKNISINGLCEETLNTLIKRPEEAKYRILKTDDTLDRILDEANLTPYELVELNKTKWLQNGEKIIVK